ncbi:hypothetical protein BDZ91DRAFT_554156 [Kalaharituber pfeilii]|nr:hypothetical protein BDZ91DRAFT_554156 [Kalaharituber pfeilii]
MSTSRGGSCSELSDAGLQSNCLLEGDSGLRTPQDACGLCLFEIVPAMLGRTQQAPGAVRPALLHCRDRGSWEVGSISYQRQRCLGMEATPLTRLPPRPCDATLHGGSPERCLCLFFFFFLALHAPWRGLSGSPRAHRAERQVLYHRLRGLTLPRILHCATCCLIRVLYTLSRAAEIALLIYST